MRMKEREMGRKSDLDNRDCYIPFSKTSVCHKNSSYYHNFTCLLLKSVPHFSAYNTHSWRKELLNLWACVSRFKNCISRSFMLFSRRKRWDNKSCNCSKVGERREELKTHNKNCILFLTLVYIMIINMMLHHILSFWIIKRNENTFYMLLLINI